MGSSCCKESTGERENRRLEEYWAAAAARRLKSETESAIQPKQEPNSDEESSGATVMEEKNSSNVFGKPVPTPKQPVAETFQIYDKTPADMTPLTRAVNKLAVDIYMKIASSQPDQNIVFSPLSIASALAALESGASGKTREAIHKLIGPAMKNTAKSGKLTSQMQGMIQKSLQTRECQNLYGDLQEDILNIPATDGELRLTTTLLRRPVDGQTLQKSVKERFKKEVVAVPVKKDAKKARQQVNRLSNDETAGKSPELLRQSRPQQQTAFVLMNSISWRMDWEGYPWAGGEGTFHSFGRKEKQKVQLIKRYSVDGFRFAYRTWIRVIELPYFGGKMFMYIVLPRLRNGIKEIEKQLNGDRLINLLRDTWSCDEMRVSVPKFKIRQTVSVLSTLGIGPSNDAISEVVHEACVEIDERGKVPSRLQGPRSYETIWKSPTFFIANHPFLFFVVHKPSWTIVFMGKMNRV